MKSYWDLLPDDLQSTIIQRGAANIIQDKTIKMFQKKYGEDWKQKIQQQSQSHVAEYQQGRYQIFGWRD